MTYTYDDEGMRTSKTVNGKESTYLYLNGKLHGEVRDGHHIHYSYDSYGNLSVIKYYTNDTDFYIYYVMTNVFGDVVSIHDSTGATKVTYEYDAWGNVISMTDTTGIGIGTINPIRYRGYYFDEETGLYYLSSRYYDPQVGRFINADGYVSTGTGVLGHNMFAYCNNEPVIYADPTGEMHVKDSAAFGNFSGGSAANPYALKKAIDDALRVLLGIGVGVGTYIGGNVLVESLRQEQFLLRQYNQQSATIDKALEETAQQYDNLQCKEAAEAMEETLKKAGKNGATIKLTFPKLGYGFVFSKRYGDSLRISENWTHYGVVYNGKAHCNVYPEGLPTDMWVKSFYDPFDSTP